VVLVTIKSCLKNYIVHYIINTNYLMPGQVFKYRHTRTPLAGGDLDAVWINHNIVKTFYFSTRFLRYLCGGYIVPLKKGARHP